MFNVLIGRLCPNPLLGVSILWQHGHKPEIAFYDETKMLVEGPERLERYNTEECVKLLTDRGFKLKAARDDL